MNKFLLLLFSLLIIASSIFAQEAKTKKIKNKKTNEHINLKGTDLFLKIPEGFEESVTCRGWDNKNGEYIVVSQSQKSFDEVCNETINRISNNGFKLQNKKLQLKINGKDALYFEATNGHKYLIIKNNENVFIIEGSATNNLDKNNNLENIMLSVFFDE
jgi:hypothetical protein